MSPHPTSPPHDADQDQRPASVLPYTEPQERAETNPTPTSPDPASGNHPVPPEEESSHQVSSDQLVGASSLAPSPEDRQAAAFALAGLLDGKGVDEREAAEVQVASVIRYVRHRTFQTQHYQIGLGSCTVDCALTQDGETWVPHTQAQKAVEQTTKSAFRALIDEYYADTLPGLTSEQADFVSGFFNVLGSRFLGSPFTVEPAAVKPVA